MRHPLVIFREISVKFLINLYSGGATEEALIVAAQAVSASTTQLVTAATVKADPNSEAQRKLTEASKRVGGATNQLVQAARNAAQWEDTADSKIKEMERQMEILRLERELELARAQLGTMRKNEYDQNANKELLGGAKRSSPAPVKGTNFVSNTTENFSLTFMLFFSNFEGVISLKSDTLLKF
jgi:hypothetical protein